MIDNCFGEQQWWWWWLWGCHQGSATKGNGFTTSWKLAVNELENRKKPRAELPDQSEKRGLLKLENSTLVNGNF